MKAATADVVVVGAGVIGCAVARELARRGLDVMVVERDSPGRRATWAAAGMLSPLAEAGGGGPFLELADASLQRYAGFAHELREETGIDVEYRTSGKLYVSQGERDGELRRLAADPVAGRFDVALVSGEGARSLEPMLSDAITLGLVINRDHRVNNRLLAQALLAAATAAGARFRTATPVAGLALRGGAIAGVRLMSGEQVATSRVVLAAGAWSGMLDGLPRPLPIRPVKGQMFSVDARSRAGGQAGERVPERLIYSAGCYIIPRDDGRLLIGATMEEAGFRKGATPRGISTLMEAAAQVLPAVADMPLIETWAGFRPASPDGMPVLGEDPAARGLFYATGHFRNGILLAPITAASLTELIVSGGTSVDLSAFRPDRAFPPS